MTCHAQQTPFLFFLHIYNFTYLLSNISSIFTIIKLFQTVEQWYRCIFLNIHFCSIHLFYPLKGNYLTKSKTHWMPQRKHVGKSWRKKQIYRQNFQTSLKWIYSVTQINSTFLLSLPRQEKQNKMNKTIPTNCTFKNALIFISN